MRIPTSALLPCLAAIPLATLLSGCAMTELAPNEAGLSNVTIKGNIHGGQQPVVGAHVYMFQANTTGYGGSSISLLVPSSTGNSDAVGGYVLTDATGSFSISGDYTCTANQEVYLYALGGNPGSGVNSAAGFMAALGDCPTSGSFLTSAPFIYMNEVSTVAAAYSFAGFAIDATHVSSSGSALAQLDIANAFLSSTNLETLSTGAALASTPAGNGVVPRATINTLANILSTCINSTGPSSAACGILLNGARANGATGTIPTDTATAAINIAHNPSTNVASLYALSTANPPFAPALTTAPNDFTLAIRFSGTGVTGSGLDGAYNIAVDGRGAIWFTNPNSNAISKLSSTGSPLSPSTGFVGGSQVIPTGIAIDPSNNAWVADAGNNTLVEYNTNGIPVSPVGGYTGGGLSSPQAVAIDGTGNVWTANFGNSSASKFANNGAVLSPSAGFGANTGTNRPTDLAIDRFGYVWLSNQQPGTGSISKLNTTGAGLTSSAGDLGGGINNPFGIAIDNQNSIWTANYAGNSLSKIDTNGNALSPSTGFSGGGINKPYQISIDGGGNVWVPNYGNSTVSVFTNAGSALSPSTGLAVGSVFTPQAVAIDGSGNVWVANYNSGTPTINAVTELIGAAVPVVTPLSVGVKNNTLASRP